MHETLATTEHVAPREKGMRGGVPQLVDLIVDRRVLLDIGVRGRDVGLGLIVVVVGNEVLDGVARQEALELGVELRRQGLVGCHDKGRTVELGHHAGDGEALATASDTEEGLVAFAAANARDKLRNGPRLVTRGLKLRDQLEVLAQRLLQRGPSGVSSIKMPSASSSFRMRSAVANSRAPRAASRCARSASMRGSLSPFPLRGSSVGEAKPEPSIEL